MLHEEQLRKILPNDKFVALKSFIQKYTSDPNVIGLFLTGSFVHGDPGPTSDLDLYIILESSETRTRGNSFVNGTEIEYFINPIRQVEQYFKDEYSDKINTAHMFANSIILYQKGPELQRLIELAQFYVSKPLPDLTEYDIYLGRYFLDDLRKDLLDALDINDKITFELVSSEIVEQLINNFGKIKKIYPAKSKRLFHQINQIDSSFANKLKNYLECTDKIQKRFELLNECIKHIENLFGGSRPDDYSFTSKLTV